MKADLTSHLRRGTHEYVIFKDPDCCHTDLFQAVSAQRAPRTRPATSAVKLATSPASAQADLLRVVVARVVSVVDPKSATRYGHKFPGSPNDSNI